MTTSKTLQFFFNFVMVMCIYLISIPVGEFVAGHDAGAGQIVFFLAVLFGMILFYVGEVFSKRYP
ncbi:hypothetical protein [Methanoregula sp.]|uniref:hypothetical protein n=1 Tax=Methanoregula sp. TaxID=2052170 RepID=UPI003C78346D